MKDLKAFTEFKVRFSEVDSMRVVWHGNYLKYFEDGREAFGLQHDLDYLKLYDLGFLTPIVHTELDFKWPLRYGDTGVIETRLESCLAAKIIHHYRIYNAHTEKTLVTGKTIQVFTDIKGQLILNNPDFYQNWKKLKGLS